MAQLLRIGIALAMVALAFVLDAVGALSSLDRVLLDGRFALNARPPSGRVVVVEIDSRSLAQLGGWPWPRHVHAELLDRLMAMEATDVAFDIDFSAASGSLDDAAFATALEAAGGYAALAAFQQNSGPDGEVVLIRPLPAFRDAATPVLVNVELDGQGLVTSFPEAIAAGDGQLPSLAAALSGHRAEAGRKTYIDYGINLGAIDRISAADLLAGTIDPARIASHQVIIGASAIELRDQFSVPRFGLVPGALVQAAALETLKAGRGLAHWGAWPGLAMILAMVALASSLGRRLSLLQAGLAGGGLVVLAEAAAWLAQRDAGILVDTAAFHLSVLLLAGMRLAHELAEEYGRRAVAQRRLAYVARHDVVTGALSRQGLLEALRLRPASLGCTILLVGIERLDLVRGALGQEVADKALALIAERLRGMRLAMLGLVDRDVFALAWDGPLGRTELEGCCDAVRVALDSIIRIEDHAVFVDTEFGSSASELPETALRQAELALAEGLRARGRGFSPFTPELEARVVSRRRTHANLRQALERGEIGVLFQPQVRLSDGVLVGVEALVRWQQAEQGMVSPAEFIPLAEETGLILPLGEFVLREACRLAAAWRWDGKLAVNVSPAQLRLSEIGGIVGRALADSRFPASRLDLEVTESLLVERSGHIAALIAGFRQHGIGIAIDDFGTGYSALSYLADFSFDKLKIDRAFISRLTPGSPSAAIVESVIGLGHRLGKIVVAEGVETEAQRQLLVEMGCDIAQGYLFGKPLPASGIEAAILAGRQRLAG